MNAVKNKLKPEVSLNDGLIAVAVGEAAETSIKLGRVVMLNEIIT